MIEWLERFLKNYRGGVLIISHDRYFLDRVAARIIELSDRTVTSYEGNYTHFMQVRTQRREALKSAYEKQQEHIRKTEEYIRKYKAGIKSKQARGRQSQLNRLERIVLPPEEASFSYFAFHKPPECAQRVAELEDVSVSFGSKDIFRHLSLLIRRGDGVALVGPNGAGKTTLLRVLVGELQSETGQVKIGSRVKIGYFPSSTRACIWSRPFWTRYDMNTGWMKSKPGAIWGPFSFMAMKFCGVSVIYPAENSPEWPF